MKILSCLCLLSLVCLSMSRTMDYPNGCIYVNGRCYKGCDKGTHSYTIGCGHLTREPTCNEPNPVPDTRGQICDYSACYCDAPTVRDEVTNKCVEPKHCTKA